ncbi:hypothetical protein DSO57_1028945 [Entomophthora muscae]|uniref:Uncharacterized protein n=1 Tax=Entomophthora muscae TaxID=34485 RepID=A0ACC2UL71_9FUNG|nr:hypothetical protein DSO57_1028945 [Entomophthora muscae]
MMAYLGLFAPVLKRLAFVAVKAAIDSLAAPWPTLYMTVSPISSSNLPLKIILASTIFSSSFCYTTSGAKMLKLSSQFNLLLLKQLTEPTRSETYHPKGVWLQMDSTL